MEYAIQAEAFSLLQRRKYNEAVDFLDKHNLFQQSVTDFEILKLFNNYLIACFHTQQFERGISVFENIQDVAPLNPHIYHNAACLYCKMKMSEKAIAQIQLARKYGGMTLISLLKSDADLDVISAHPDFIQAVLPVNRKFTPGIITKPFEGVNHFQFDELTQNEMVSMFFIFKVCFSDLRKEVIRSMISTITSKEDWSDGLVDYTGSFRGWRDRTFIGNDFMTIHIKNV
ncbi:MAG: hypothetical protein O9262_04905, partial [Cyclobacteriaceae bacterium]|nr:hypothetical protein [Cyclobacteriaceae bacterium]